MPRADGPFRKTTRPPMPNRCPNDPALSRGALTVVLCALPPALACAASMAPRPVDRVLQARVDRIVEPAWEEMEAFRENELLYPQAAPSDPAAGPVEPPPPRPLDLAACLAAAFETNRDFLSQRERLILAALDLIGARNTFDPQLSALLAASIGDTDFTESDQDASASASLTKILHHGGRLSLDGTTQWNAIAGDGEFSSSVSVRLIQPLLRGFGWLTTHEPLIQAERSLVYAIRAFELFREDLSIDVASRYYSVVGLQQAIDNLEANFDRFVFARRQAEAVFALGSTTELDILRARREELNAENQVLEAKENYQLAVDELKIFLGLPVDQPVTIIATEPTLIEVDYELQSAVEIAFANRLDYLTRQDQVEDLERAVRLARDGMRPDLDLDARFGLAGDPSPGFGDQQVDEESWSVGLTFDPLLNRVDEKNAHRAAQISHDRALRALDLFEQNLMIEIRRSFRELKRRRSSLDIQEELIVDQERRLKVANLRFEAGDVGNRDVVEANQDLLDARNALIGEKVNYEIARLRLLRQLGILFVDDQGMVQE